MSDQSLEQLQAQMAVGYARLTESLSALIDNYVDPREAYLGPNGEMWHPVGSSAGPGNLHAEPYLTAVELDQIRNVCRWISYSNEFAINGHENRISYIVGWGHTYVVRGRSKEVPDAIVARVQDWLDRWLRINRWHSRQQESVLRTDRDGETFRRLFRGEDGVLRVRFVEPWRVREPNGAKANQSFGVETDPEDVETVWAYWIDGSQVDAGEIQHIKANVDSGHKRGLPLFWPVRKNLNRASKLLRNMSTATEIQTAIAMIRKHQQATKEAVRSFVQSRANNKSGDKSVLNYPSGTILDAPEGTEYEFPKVGLDPEKTVKALQAELRAVASRLVMPEFMLTSDASNANYSSTMVAEGPAVKKFEREQHTLIEYDLEIVNAALQYAAACGQLAQEDVDAIDVHADPPSVRTRDELQEAQVAQIRMAMGILSPQTASSEAGLQYHDEQIGIEQHQERSGMPLTPDRPPLMEF